MTEGRRPYRRGRRPYKRQPGSEASSEPNPYKDGESEGSSVDVGGEIDEAPTREIRGSPNEDKPSNGASPRGIDDRGLSDASPPPEAAQGAGPPSPTDYPPRREEPRRDAPRRDDPRSGGPRRDDARRDDDFQNKNGRRNRRHRGRGRRDNVQQQLPPQPVVADSETIGWFDSSRDGGYIRRASNSYLADSGDAWLTPQLIRQHSLRRGDLVGATTGRDQRGRVMAVEVTQINGEVASTLIRRPDFGSLTATYPERRLTLETGRPAKGGPELTRRAIDLVAPIGYGQRALIVAPARAGKTMLLHAITEGIALNHPNATLLILLVDERPEEVSEAISWGVGEVVASSFDQPADRHVEVCEMVLEHARRLVEMGKDVVIVLDSLTRMARAHNTAERGSGRTMSGGLDTSAMAKPKAFFGSARAVHPKDGGGSLTIIATALVETGSRMDDVIFEEFKGTGNCEIKLDRSLSEKRIFPAFDVAASGTRREEKLYKDGQLDAIYTLRRGLQQMPPQAGMEWLVKRIAATQNNDALLAGL
jgi:transcription termination factor Rho